MPLGASTRKMVTLERNTRLSYLAVYSSDCFEMFDIEDPHSNTACQHELDFPDSPTSECEHC